MADTKVAEMDELPMFHKDDDKKTYSVHKDLLCAASIFFKKAFEGGWKEAEEGIFNILDVKPVSFNAFLDWLYFRQVPVVAPAASLHCMNCGGKCERKLSTMMKKKMGWKAPSHEDEAALDEILGKANTAVHLYALADRLDVPLLREQIVNCLWHYTYNEDGEVGEGSAPHVQELLIAHQLLPENARLLKLLVDATGMHINTKSLKCVFDSVICQRLPASLWLRFFMMSMSRSEARQRPRVKQLCWYHEHGEGKLAIEACDAKMARQKRRIQEQQAPDKMLKSIIVGRRPDRESAES